MNRTREYALIMLVFSLVILIGARFGISDPSAESELSFQIPGRDNVPVFRCPFRSLTGVPCPVCGLTRSSAFMVRGDIAPSFKSHPLGPIFITGLILAVPWSIYSFFRKEKDEKTGKSHFGRYSFAIVIGLVLIGWIINLARHFDLIRW